MTWRILDLFSGIGGFSLAAQWCWGDELEIVAFCEIDKFCQKVLHKHWPNVPIVEDVRDVTKEILANTRCGKQRECCHSNEMSIEWNSKERSTDSFSRSSSNGIDLLTGGFPCQPFSVAGKRKGKEDNRFLWPEMFAVIKEIRPHWVVAENVSGIVRMALDDCLSDLEGEGYSTGTVIIPACAVNAPHRRDRVWIVAYSEKQGGINGLRSGLPRWRSSRQTEIEEYGRGKRRPSDGWWSTEPDVGRVAHGVPSRVDRLKSLGNAIVPQVAYQIMEVIKSIEENLK